MYDRGFSLYCRYCEKGVKEDYRNALKWFHMAAERGHGEAMYVLGWEYYCVQKDREEAVKWWRKAVEHGDPTAREALMELEQSEKLEQ